MSLEQNNAGEFRFYHYDPEDGSEPVDLLSVTSIRALCGENYHLVNWKMANLADAALGTAKRITIGPRGGVRETRQVWEYPSEFAKRYAATKGEQGAIDALRKWLREQGDEPKNVAAVRGSMTHKAIEKGVAWDRIERPYVEAAYAGLSSRDRKRVKRAVTDEDVSFVRNSVRHHWDMRETLPMVILAREVPVVNLAAGYGGTFDALIWLLGDFDADGAFVDLELPLGLASLPKWDAVTLADIQRIGGMLILLDYKTAKDLHTDNVTQAHAYLAAEFAVIDGKRDERVTDLLNAAMFGGLAHIRPDGWGLYLFPVEAEAIRAFLASCAYARYLAKYPKPDAIFTQTIRGASDESDTSTEDDE